MAGIVVRDDPAGNPDVPAAGTADGIVSWHRLIAGTGVGAAHRPEPETAMKNVLLLLLLCVLALRLAGQEIVEAKAEKASVSAARAAAQKAWEQQDWPAASDAYRKVVTLARDDGEAWHHLGYALHAQQRLDEALEAHMQATRFEGWAPVGWYNAACVHALKGHKDQAIECLEKAVAAGFADRNQIDGDTDFDGMRDDARFQKLVKSMASAPSAKKARPFVVDTKRGGARLAFFTAGGSPGQLALDYGQPVWKDEYAALIDSPKLLGKRWRCGQDFWTTFDTNVALTVGGQDIPAGAYYLTLEHRDADHYLLAFNDPAVIRGQKLDAFQAAKSSGGIEVPVQVAKGDKVAAALEFGFVAGKKLEDATLQLRYGPFTIDVPIAIHFDEK
ncbi:MAG: DUF2911 domain-containing protein [Planctomycetota bacterium]